MGRKISNRERMMMYLDHAAQAYFIRLSQQIHDLRRERDFLKKALAEVQGINLDLAERLKQSLKDQETAQRDLNVCLKACGTVQVPTHHTDP